MQVYRKLTMDRSLQTRRLSLSEAQARGENHYHK